MDNMFLSIIIPTFNEETRILDTLNEITTYLQTFSHTWEIIVSDDGSTDMTRDIVSDFNKEHPHTKLISLRHSGKGSAVKNGMLAAVGTYRFICDADLSMPIQQIDRFLPDKNQCADIIVGSREENDSKRIGEPRKRHIMGRVYNKIIRMLFATEIRDTQCGFKCFRWDSVENIFRRQRINGFAFDMEILFLASKANLKIKIVGIDWYYDHDSRVKPFVDAIYMLRDLAKIRIMYALGKYHQ